MRLRNYTGFVAIASLGLMLQASQLLAQTDESNKVTREPVYRVAELPANSMTEANTTIELPADINAENAATTTAHPLDAAIKIARSRLETIRRDVKDYQAIMVKRERIDGVLREPEFLKVKIRNRRIGETNVPFSVYLRFLKPKENRGREVIYVEGQNNGKLIAHDVPGTIKGMLTVYLDPTGWMAMENSRHPIYEAGLENLVVKLVEKAERDRAAGQCEVEYIETAKINDRPCTKIKVTHAERKEPYDFHVAEVYIDQELQVPVRYAAYDWPATAGGEPELMEEYTYLNLELNVGLTDLDFDPKNPGYDYP